MLLFLSVIFSLSNSTAAIAYTFSQINPKFNDPLSVSVYIRSSIPYLADVTEGYNNWDYLSELDSYRSYDEDYSEVYILYSTYSTDAYAETSRVGSSNWKQITIRPSWKGLTPLRRCETVAHEMGHAWGQGHSSVTPSLMTPFVFIDSAYPTVDDENGIHALY